MRRHAVARVLIGALIGGLAAAGPTRAAPPETAPAPEPPPLVPVVPNPPPYEYPTYPVKGESTIDWFAPDGWHYPAVVGDLLFVRPLMVAGLIGGGALFVATLPISAATCTTREWIHTLQDHAAYTFERPLGAF